jgi:hypothetical protein
MVKPTLACDLTKLEQEFGHGYREGACMFYVSTTNESGEMEVITTNEQASFNSHWEAQIKKFDAFLDNEPEL